MGRSLTFHNGSSKEGRPRLQQLPIATAQVQHAPHGAAEQGLDDELLPSAHRGVDQAEKKGALTWV